MLHLAVCACARWLSAGRQSSVIALAIALTMAGAAAAQLPAVTGTLQFHLDAGVGVTTSGSAVTQWNDQSAGGLNDFNQATGSLQPTLVSNVINGRPVVRFNSDRLDAAAGHTLNNANALPFTFFAVTANTTNPFGLFDSRPSQANVFRFASFNGANPSNPNNAVELWDASPFVPVFTSAAGSVISTQAFLNPGRNLSNRVISGSGLTALAAFNTSTAQIGFDQPDIGSINGGANGFYSGDIAEMISYSGQLSVPDRYAIEVHLREKYNLNPPVLGVPDQLPNPRISGSAVNFPGFDEERALDGDPTTDYASNNQADDTFINFDFGEPTLITQVNYSDRISGTPQGADNVTAFNLIFSDDAIFGAGDTVVNVPSPLFANTDIVPINGGAGIMAQFLQWDVVTTTGVNPGAAEFAFFTTEFEAVPEPASIAIWSIAAAAVFAGLVWRRRSK
jgi:hypothetical protein